MAGWRLRPSDGGWVVVPPDGSTLDALLSSAGSPGVYLPEYGSRRLALDALTAAAVTDLTPDGLLPEVWQSDAGIAFSQPTGPERDFTDVAWTWRDPSSTLVPLMLQSVTAPGHDDAELAGFVTTISETGGTVHAAGRFYANEAGVAFRDLLLGGRRFGVSVDPGEHTDAEWVCEEYDADGFCSAGRMSFTAYEIAGLTGTPFPGFENASIMLAASDRAASALLTASGGISVLPPTYESGAGHLGPMAVRTAPAFSVARGVSEFRRLRYEAPPEAYYYRPEPDLGGPDGDLLVEQEDGTYGVPLTIEDSGAVFGHVARWGQCHTGYPDECVSAPPSRTGYAGFHLGITRTAEGSEIPTGTLTAGCDHAAIRLRAPEARQHYDHSGTGWSTTRASDGTYGIWVAGALRPDVTDEQADLLRSLSLSGDWRRDRGTGSLEMLAVLAVNIPGFPQRRTHVLTASGIVSGPLAWWNADEEIETLVASGMVRRLTCSDCGPAGLRNRGMLDRISALEVAVEDLTRLTIRR